MSGSLFLIDWDLIEKKPREINAGILFPDMLDNAPPPALQFKKST
jgi:hypothetical protein